MFKSYLQIAWRNLLKDRLYSFINVTGLAVGLASCLLLLLFVKDETSFDSFWPDATQIHRVSSTYVNPGMEPNTQLFAAGPVKQAMKDYFGDDLAEIARMNRQWPILKTRDEIYEEPIYIVDPEIIDILSFNVMYGDLSQTINDNASIALSEELANKYFGKTDVLEEIITIESWGVVKDYRVGAVYQNPPHNTHLEGLNSALIKLLEEDYTEEAPWMFENWNNPNNILLFQLTEGVNITKVNNQFDNLVKEKGILPPFLQETFSSPEEWLTLGSTPIVEIYINEPGRQTNIAIFSAIAILILVIACINFTNLSIAKSTRRAKEVALRKVMGASRKQLVFQFLGETLFITSIALIFAMVLVEIAMPFYNQFLERDLLFDYSLGNASAIIALVLCVGMLGGIYPAMVLSGFRPAKVLKANKSTETSGSLMLRNLLVIAQFSISILLIICAMVMYTQRQHAMNMELGYDKDHTLILHGVGREPLSEPSRQQLLQEQISTLPGMLASSYIQMFPATSQFWFVPTTLNREDESQFQQTLHFRNIDEGFLDTFNIALLAGRYFDRNIAQDTPATFQEMNENAELRHINTIINLKAAEQLGFESPSQALGTELEYMFGDMRVYANVVGVIDNVNYRSVREPINAEVYVYNEFGGFLAVRFTDSPQKAEQTLRQFWKEQVPELPFVRTFVGELIERDFQGEQKRAQLLATASTLAVIVSCLGLFGLASFAAERRVKEIGIRKVMGASVMDIVKLLTWQFSRPVVIACIIGCLSGSILMFSWLQEFPYRISELWILASCLTASAMAIIIAWLTVGGKASKVARATPIKALRYE